MDLLDSTTQYAAGGTAVVLLAAFFLLPPNNLIRWLQRKNYQYEVTFALYMLTPTEKFVFNSMLFLTLSMLFIASFLYLPDHICLISRRVYYYFAGDTALMDASRTVASQLGGKASKASEAVLGAVYQAAVNTATAAQEAVNQAAENLGWT